MNITNFTHYAKRAAIRAAVTFQCAGLPPIHAAAIVKHALALHENGSSPAMAIEQARKLARGVVA